MKIKSLILSTAAAVLLAGTSLAMADNVLTTTNNSNDYSSVKVGPLCSGTLGQWTGPGQPQTKTPWAIVTSLCGKSTGSCNATLYLDPTTVGKTCGGSSATVSMDLSSGNISAPSSLDDINISTAPYQLTIG
ncbi:MAG: hypothetical protein A3E87_04285 [Gammaproteobacteria bacterium RIFCSPHIGHO2_12_FULL_35_23]|nr:MAG: hypothetical protein A3E87_04285 [Gammaproteobacteria bacterium RIFCSPHIGHO2_12_FULL_35_23]